MFLLFIFIHTLVVTYFFVDSSKEIFLQKMLPVSLSIFLSFSLSSPSYKKTPSKILNLSTLTNEYTGQRTKQIYFVRLFIIFQILLCIKISQHLEEPF